MHRRLVAVPVLLLLTLAACSGGTGDATTGTGGTGGTGGAGSSGGPTASGEVPTTGGSAGSSGPTSGDPTGMTGSDPSGPATTDPATTDPGATDTSPGTTQGTDTGDDPPPLDETACQGYATRYWDCCKAHCGWEGNVNPATEPLQSCNKNDQSLGPVYDVMSSCQSPAEGSAFTCYDEAPWAVSAKLAYGFAAVPAQGDVCGRCYQLEFDGTGHYNAQDPGSVALTGKTMIVQATNIGFDVGGGQFDILTPGGGVGLFDACSYQWGVATAELGATYGGFMTKCQEQHPGDHAKQKECVLGRCAAVFDDPVLAPLAKGCEWYVGWYEAADNPNLHYQEVACPAALVAVSGIDRGALGDIAACQGGASCSQQEMDNCDCAWTNGGKNCGQDDGSCCWTACCA
ncbi:hypothetical protein [Nannocystis sp.]|uniref:hypothetical protein n=1 Tax=Nannocystis sp. TaxID=1962667 RepID=UPI0025F5343A|nr:hypothetical protein [Nannocystis sp.]